MADIVAIVNVQTYDNEDLVDALTLSDASGGPVDLTGIEAVMDIRSAADSATQILELSTANGRLSIPAPATDGVLAFNLPVDVTTKLLVLPVADYVYDIVLIQGTARDTVIRGKLKVKRGVTR